MSFSNLSSSPLLYIKCTFSCLEKYNSLLTGLLVSKPAPLHSALSRAIRMVHMASRHLHEEVQLLFQACMALHGSLLPTSQAVVWIPATAALTGSSSLHAPILPLIFASALKLNVFFLSVRLVLQRKFRVYFMLNIRACMFGKGEETRRGPPSHVHISVSSSPTQGPGPELFVCRST